MNAGNLQKLCECGMKVGFGIAVVPAAVTAVVACSKIIFINIIADIAVRILTANTISMTVYGIELVAVPLMWKFSLIAAVAGGTLIAISGLASLVIDTFQERTCTA